MWEFGVQASDVNPPFNPDLLNLDVQPASQARYSAAAALLCDAFCR
jgi:hypothetical protein